MSEPYPTGSPLVVMIRDENLQRELVLKAIKLDIREDEIVERILQTIVELHLLDKFLDGGIREEFDGK
jgi:hypothetical protein